MQAYGLVLAGGVGRRMGSDVPKQYLMIGGKAILSHTISRFLDHPALSKVVVLVPEDWMDYTKEILQRDFGEEPDIEVIAGGELRNDTIMNGIAYIKDHYPYDEETIVVTHDAVRPFVTAEMITANVAAMKDYVCCDTVIPATDTIVESLDHTAVTSVPDRAYLYQGQTPQSFRMLKFEALYQSLTEEEKQILTDAVKAFVIKGEQVVLVDGAASNIKITYPSDVEMAKAILGAEKGN